MQNSEKNNESNPDASMEQNIRLETSREKQCRFRSASCCQLITSLLGWNDGMPIEMCDKCWNGGFISEESKEFRRGYAGTTVNMVKSMMREGDYAEVVLQAMFGRHLGIKIAERYLISMCKRLGQDKSVKLARIIDKRIDDDGK